jgi:HEAT repeat protein
MPKSDIPLDDLIQQLHASDWTARCDAARLLGQSRDPRAVDALLPDLQDADWRVRRNAAQALGALGDKRATEPLLALLKDRTLTVRQRAIVGLGRLKDLQALPALIDILLGGTRESYDASKAIRKFGKKALPDLARVYESTVHQELLLLLVDLKYAGVFDLLVASLKTGDPSARQRSIQEFGKLGDKRAIPYLMDELSRNDPVTQIDSVNALGKLGAIEAVPVLLALLKDDELYGPRSGLYRAVANAFQLLSGLTVEIDKAFPGNYPAMFNMGGTPFSLPEMMGLLGNSGSNPLNEALSRMQSGSRTPEDSKDPITDAIHKSMENVDWKFGVMVEDARDAKQERVTHMIKLLSSDSGLTRAAAALNLPWYGDERSLDALRQLTRDPDETVRLAAAWSVRALEKAISYRNQFGM